MLSWGAGGEKYLGGGGERERYLGAGGGGVNRHYVMEFPTTAKCLAIKFTENLPTN